MQTALLVCRYVGFLLRAGLSLSTELQSIKKYRQQKDQKKPQNHKQGLATVVLSQLPSCRAATGHFRDFTILQYHREKKFQQSSKGKTTLWEHDSAHLFHPALI